MPEAVTVPSEAPLQVGRAVDVFKAAREAGAAPDDLRDRLARQHTQYVALAPGWQRMGDIALNRISSDASKKAYLVQGDTEDKKHFDKRVEISAFLPETPGLLGDFVGAVFSKPARRNFIEKKDKAGKTSLNPVRLIKKVAKAIKAGRTRDKINAFLDAAGPEGQPLSRMAELAASDALTYGAVDAFLDRGPEGSETPQLVLYTPERRLDWEEGEDGLFAWVKYHECRSVQKTWDGDRVVVDEYRIITAPKDGNPATAQLFRVTDAGGKNEKVEAMPAVELGFTSIPVRTLYWDRQAVGIGRPWVKPMVEGDIKVFRQESDLTWDIFVHAHPWLVTWSKKKLSEIKPGANWALHLNPGGEEAQREDIKYLAPDMAELNLQMLAIQETRDRIKELAGNGSDAEKMGGNPESGVALAYRMAQRSKNFKRMAGGLAEWEWQIIELVAGEGMSETPDLSGILEIVYPDKFDQRTDEQLLAALFSARAIGSPTAVVEVSRKLAAVLVGDGATQETLDQIDREVMAAAQKPIETNKPGEDEREEKEPEAVNS